MKDRYNSGVAYASVTSHKEDFGSVANEYGVFELNVPGFFLQDSIFIYAPGYQRGYCIASNLYNSSANVVSLNDLDVYDNFNIDSLEPKFYCLGRPGKGSFQATPQFNELGGQIANAIFMEEQVKISNVSFYLKQCAEFQ